MTHCGISSWHISVFILHTCQCTIMSCNTSKIYSLDVDLTYGTGGIWPDIYFEKVYSPTPLVFSFSNIQSMSILNILRFRKRFFIHFPLVVLMVIYYPPHTNYLRNFRKMTWFYFRWHNLPPNFSLFPCADVLDILSLQRVCI